MLRAQIKRSINTSLLLLLLLLKNSGGARLFLGLRVKIYVGVFRLECSSLCCVARQYVSVCGQTFVVLQDSMDLRVVKLLLCCKTVWMCVVKPLLCCKTVWICVWSNLCCVARLYGYVCGQICFHIDSKIRVCAEN